MYLAVIFVIGKILSGFLRFGPSDVIIKEIPNPDVLLNICLNIYLVREARDFVLEQVLFCLKGIGSRGGGVISKKLFLKKF